MNISAGSQGCWRKPDSRENPLVKAVDHHTCNPLNTTTIDN